MSIPLKKSYDTPMEQDSKRFVPLLFLCLFPLTAALPHAHAAALLWLVLFFGVLLVCEGVSSPIFSKKVMFYCLFWCYSASGLLLPAAFLPTLLSLLLRLAFFLPHLFPRVKGWAYDALPLSGGLLGGAAVAELLLGKGETGYHDTAIFAQLSRAAGPFGNPNLLAAFLLPAALLALGGALWGERRRGYLVCFFSSLAGVCATFSRGAILALAVGVLWLLWQRFGARDLLTGGLLLLPAATLLLPGTLAARLRSLLLVDSSVFYRFSLWESVFRVPLPFLLFGVGEGKRAMLALLSPVLAAGLSHVEHTHSLFLHLLVAGGLVGLFLFLLCILTALCGKGRRECRAALLALLLFGLFDDPLYSGQTEVIFWLVLGLC